MSVQFGRWNFDNEQPTLEYFEKISESIAPYGPDSKEFYSGTGIRILYRAFHTTKEARCEKQPHLCPCGAVITWDGRLDNRDELVDELRPYVTPADSDITIVAAAFDRWSTNCFARLVGDWALSIWNPRNRSLVLAKDPIGPRHLYYSLDDKQVTWSTVLDPLVLFAGKTFELCEEYIAGWLSLYPATHLTPYVGIHAVPPATCVFLGPRKHIVAKYWDFDANTKIRYCSDAEYEEHFRTLFFTSVRRRLRSDAPVLAELSGGRDSSSIVCVADEIIARGETEALRLDTISYYDDSEPNWNERRYFTIVEKKRGRAGWHISPADISAKRLVDRQQAPDSSFVVPHHLANQNIEQQLSLCLASSGSRVVLSGFAGDEVMGGPPFPFPELQDLMATARLNIFAHQLKLWALQLRKPLLLLLTETIMPFLPCYPILLGRSTASLSWLRPNFTKRHRRPLSGYSTRVKLFSSLPSFQYSLLILNSLRRQLSCTVPLRYQYFERCYPYLDRTLLSFMFAIPREQLVRPTQRRSLMRRALSGIVPEEILDRRKAFVARAPFCRLSTHWPELSEMTQNMLAESFGIVDAQTLLNELHQARCGKEAPIVKLMRTISLEGWLRHIHKLGIVSLRATPRAPLELGTSLFQCKGSVGTDREAQVL